MSFLIIDGLKIGIVTISSTKSRLYLHFLYLRPSQTTFFLVKKQFMKKLFTLILLTVSVSPIFAQFTMGNLVIYRVGDGSAALASTGAAVFLDEYTPTGTLVQSIALPTSVSGNNKRVVASGSATSEGSLTRSTNGLYLIATGYDAAVGTAAVTSSTSASTARVIATIDNSKTINSSTALSDFSSGNNIRSAASVDGNSFWVVGGATGVSSTTLGATTSTLISSTVTNIRTVNITDGQLYISTSSGTAIRIGTVGTGLPTTTGQTITALPGSPTSGSPYNFFLADLDANVAGPDVLYIADDASGTGLQKYSLVNGTWTSNGNIAITSNGLRGITGLVSGSTVTLYCTNGTTFSSLVDASGYNTTITGSFTNLATAATNTAFRGIAFAPTATALPVNLSSFSASLVNSQPQLNWGTSNETNFDYFGVEKSIDAKNFAEIAKVASNKASNGSTYQYTDINKTLSTQFYRLKLVDNDGTFKYSSVVAVNAKPAISLALFPNPVTNTIILSHPKAIAGAAVSITSIDGKILATQNVQTGATQTSIDATKLVKGNYVVSFVNNGVASTTQLVKQ